MMSTTARQRWPVWAVVCGLWLAVIALLSLTLQHTGGNFNYALDDAYIHLAMARNFAEYGVWGITRQAFSASTSSPAYTLLLSIAIASGGQPEGWPMIINVLCATAFLFVADRILVRAGLEPPMRLTALLFITLIAPLPTLVFSGMEHVLQLLLVALLFGLLQRYPLAPPSSRKLIVAFFVVVALATLVRYETAFLTLPLAGYFAWRRDWRLAATLIVATALGPLLVGMVQVAQGWYFLPNSILAKGANLSLNAEFLGSVLNRFVLNLARSSVLFLLALVVVLWVVLQWRRGMRLRETAMGLALSFIVATLAQYALAQIGWLYRYEAYLIVFGSLLVFTQRIGVGAWQQLRGRRLSPVVLVGLTVLTLALVLTYGYRMVQAWDDVPIVMETTYRQDNQMARFVARYYPDTTVVANDIGLIAYRSGARVLDLDGLGSRASLDAHRGGYYDAAFVERWARDEGAQIAVIHDEFYRRLPAWPANWIRVGEWRVPDYFINGDAIIAFYALTPEAAKPLKEALQAFTPSLPAPVQAHILPD